MNSQKVFSLENVLLTRRGHYIEGSLLLSRHHMVFTFRQDLNLDKWREIWICYPVIEKISKSRGPSWMSSNQISFLNPDSTALSSPKIDDFDTYLVSHIKVFCKDFTYYSFDFRNDPTCVEAFEKISRLVNIAKGSGLKRDFYAFDYRPNMMESKLQRKGWNLYDPVKEFKRQNLVSSDGGTSYWRLSEINVDYKLCISYPQMLLVPSSVSDSVLQHAGKFRLKQRIPVVVYKHRLCPNGNIIARCAQPLVGLNFQNRSLQDEKLVEEIFRTQERECKSGIRGASALIEQPQRNLIVDLRPITNAMAQHALGAGTEIIDNYRAKKHDEALADGRPQPTQKVEKIFCNIDNIHVMRDSLNKLVSVLSDLDKYPISTNTTDSIHFPSLQQLFK